MSSNLVSIVLPTYNGEKYISQSIESCLNQTYENIELIIVNDCSTDSTLEIVKKYTEKDSRIKVFSNEVNKKLPASLNIGFSYAKGKYLTWTSDDNFYNSNAIETMFNYLESRKELDVVFTDFTVIDENNHFLYNTNLDNYGNIIEKNVIGACFMYKRIVHEGLNGYDENLFLVEDYDFWIRALGKFKFSHLKKNLYSYRGHSDSLASNNAKEIYNELYFTSLEKNITTFHWIRKTHKIQLFNILLKYYLRKKNIVKSIQYLINLISSVLIYSLPILICKVFCKKNNNETLN